MENKDISLRQAFGNSLVGLAKKHKNFVVLDADVAGGTCTNIFRSSYPDRFIQCGIAEQNMMSVAAGLSTLGIIPIVTCYAVFASMRAIEQARNSIAYPNFNVKVVASHVGLDVGPDGPTHQAIEDIAIYRAIANFKVIAPCDPMEIESALDVLLKTDGPVYMRTGRSPVPYVYKNLNCNFEFGKADVLRDGKDVVIMASGVMVHRGLNAANILRQKGIDCAVLNISSIKPIDEDTIVRFAKKTGAVVTAEDHNIFGGVGSAVSEVLCKKCPVHLEMVGIEDLYAESGEPKDLAAKYCIDENGIIEAVSRVVNRKIRKKT